MSNPVIKILGVLDLFVGIVFWAFGIFGIIPNGFILVLGLFLLVKGIVFLSGLSIASILDIFSSILIITASSVVLPKLVITIVSLFLLQKGIFSWVG
jgi:hypothetical protein